MQIVYSRRIILTGVILALLAAGIALIFLKISGRTIAQAAGFDSGKTAALAGVEAFYSVDYHDSQDLWAARLCAVSSQAACGFYQNSAAPYLWTGFKSARTVVSAQASAAQKLADIAAYTDTNAPMQVWQVEMKLSAPWPQGDGRTAFPAYVLVAKEGDSWKFERLLLEDELAQYVGGKDEAK